VISETYSRRLFSAALRRTGRRYEADLDLPSAYLLSTMGRRACQLARGYLRTRRSVFLGRRVELYNRKAISLGRGVSIGKDSTIDGYARDGVRLAPGSRLGSHCVVTCTSHASRYGVGFSLGSNSGLGDGTHVGASGGVSIGADVIGGPFVSFHSQEHSFDDGQVPIRLQGTTERGITVADNCWIGARATILDGTIIGPGSVVAAGAVVRGEFPGRSLIAGVPAKVLRELEP
jgi:acetyltransferase-like isoleucine patch superfamily enzyme